VKITQVILVVAGLGATAWGYWTSLEDEPKFRAPVDASLESKESVDALGLLRQLVKSTNTLDACMSPKAPPMARRQVLQWSGRFKKGSSLVLKEAAWKGEYFSIAVTQAGVNEEPQAHYFHMVKDSDGTLRILGLQN